MSRKYQKTGLSFNHLFLFMLVVMTSQDSRIDWVRSSAFVGIRESQLAFSQAYSSLLWPFSDSLVYPAWVCSRMSASCSCEKGSPLTLTQNDRVLIYK